MLLVMTEPRVLVSVPMSPDLAARLDAACEAAPALRVDEYGRAIKSKRLPRTVFIRRAIEAAIDAQQGVTL